MFSISSTPFDICFWNWVCFTTQRKDVKLKIDYEVAQHNHHPLHQTVSHMSLLALPKCSLFVFYSVDFLSDLHNYEQSNLYLLQNNFLSNNDAGKGDMCVNVYLDYCVKWFLFSLVKSKFLSLFLVSSCRNMNLKRQYWIRNVIWKTFCIRYQTYYWSYIVYFVFYTYMF